MWLGLAVAVIFLTSKEEIERFLTHSHIMIVKHRPTNLRASMWITYDMEEQLTMGPLSTKTNTRKKGKREKKGKRKRRKKEKEEAEICLCLSSLKFTSKISQPPT